MITNDLKPCKKHYDCFANKSRLCSILYETDFGSNDCPFYKTKEAVKASRKRCRQRLSKINISFADNIEREIDV